MNYSALGPRQVRTVLALGLGAAAPLLTSASAWAAPSLTFSTKDHPLGSAANQGWWAPAGTSFSNIEPNYNVDLREQAKTNARMRDFFTFYVSPYGGTASSASLTIAPVTSAIYGLANEATETIGFFDVTTPAQTLNVTAGQSTAIFNDLGSGVQYANVVVSADTFSHELWAVTLNASALAGIDAARGGYFSIGGALLSGDGDDAVYFGGPSNVTLTIETVPVPPALSTGVALAGLIGLRCRLRRTASA